jgi:predicted  nucleic acid-binding Zn-ribbon protein
MEELMSIFARCVLCNKEFTEKEIENSTCCPNCGCKGIPVAPENDVNVKINWHELRILVIWAENWAHQIAKSDPEKYDYAPESIYAIAHRLEKQHPKKGSLSLAGEIKELRQHYPGVQSTHPGDDGT